MKLVRHHSPRIIHGLTVRPSRSREHIGQCCKQLWILFSCYWRKVWSFTKSNSFWRKSSSWGQADSSRCARELCWIGNAWGLTSIGMSTMDDYYVARTWKAHESAWTEAQWTPAAWTLSLCRWYFSSLPRPREKKIKYKSSILTQAKWECYAFCIATNTLTFYLDANDNIIMWLLATSIYLHSLLVVLYI